MSVICRTHLSGTYCDSTNGRLNNACANPGLAFERYLPSDGEEGSGHQSKENAKAAQIAFLKSVCAASNQGAGSLYYAAYERWKEYVGAVDKVLPVPPSPEDADSVFDWHVASETMSCSSRVIMGLGNDTGLEVGMTFNRTYGMPIIPGSALKGLCRRYYLKQIRGEDDSHFKNADGKIVSVPNATFHTLFGSTDAGGLITFFDAWYKPCSALGGPLKQDVMTPHHPKSYYGDQGRTPPTDFDDPTPVPFLSVSGSFLFAVKGPTEAWTRFAMDLLKLALSDFGVGAKTSSGYGRFGVVGSEQLPPAPSGPNRHCG